MRDDMAKVVTERRRRGHGNSSKKTTGPRIRAYDPDRDYDEPIGRAKTPQRPAARSTGLVADTLGTVDTPATSPGSVWTGTQFVFESTLCVDAGRQFEPRAEIAPLRKRCAVAPTAATRARTLESTLRGRCEDVNCDSRSADRSRRGHAPHAACRSGLEPDDGNAYEAGDSVCGDLVTIITRSGRSSTPWAKTAMRRPLPPIISRGVSFAGAPRGRFLMPRWPLRSMRGATVTTATRTVGYARSSSPGARRGRRGSVGIREGRAARPGECRVPSASGRGASP
jgi:hypothetical protein